VNNVKKAVYKIYIRTFIANNLDGRCNLSGLHYIISISTLWTAHTLRCSLKITEFSTFISFGIYAKIHLSTSKTIIAVTKPHDSPLNCRENDDSADC